MLKKLHLHIHSITYQFIYHSFFHKLLKKKRSFFSTNKTELLYPAEFTPDTAALFFFKTI